MTVGITHRPCRITMARRSRRLLSSAMRGHFLHLLTGRTCGTVGPFLLECRGTDPFEVAAIFAVDALFLLLCDVFPSAQPGHRPCRFSRLTERFSRRAA